ncbi:MAG: substrate-binding domain-containing protein [Clostridia bacterium]|nr:substrate-binding domain-containing protein [Clostridia bacterium]
MENKTLRFIYITPFADEDFFLAVKRGMDDAAQLLGVSAHFTGTHDSAIDVLADMVKKAIAENYDGIALSLADPTAFREAALMAKAAGIPLISFNMDSPDTYRMAGVCQNFIRAGQTFGREALEHLEENSTVLITMHDAGVVALEERVAGIKEIITQKKLNIKTIVSGNTPELARDTILQHITPEVSAILCTGQSDTHGAGLAAVQLQRPIYVAGFDVCDEIRTFVQDGVIDFTIDQQPYVQGFYPLLMMVQYLRLGIMPFDIDTGNAVIRSVQ